MLLALKILLGLLTAVLALLGIRWMFTPEKMMAETGIQATKNIGRSNLRGDIGGILIAGAVMMGMFLYEGGDKWLYPGILLLGTVAFGRVVSLIMDGKSKQGMISIVVELLIIALLLGVNQLS